MKSEPAPTIRQPSRSDALIPLIFMIVMLTWSVILFGIDAASGPLQVALLMSAVVAGVVAYKNGHPWDVLGEEIVKGISLAMSAILILLMVGALIWRLESVRYDCHRRLLRHSVYQPHLVLLRRGAADWDHRDCHRNSWMTAATLGVAFVGQTAGAIGASTAITAGAVISGAYFGDKMTPLWI